ncbi:sulfite transporter TauE/SafE [Saccharomonospora piscinae]|uniref:Probable membrane transporter protein n=1 Tax=Saccharomonospora piscinae TaxID=687388 RepID=A0A1V9A9M5_SACPI|nr:sulfite exporter TauE/SafE family protein [Saccharomonospora piscinae]OQO93793.1 sulfite transporter TauE/SafE [Saccharomonospora piscinae]TLW94955.1 sulfite exporter TauE/SafE family protein [Saccharomonospora piscinae]
MSEILLAGLALACGALVQGAVGYGMNLIAAPLLTLVDPRLVPVPLLVIALAHALLTVAREHRHVDWRGVGFVTAGRLPGTALGVLAVALLAPRAFAGAVAVAVLVCVVLSVVSWTPRPAPRSLLVAGLASGTFGTASSIGGPPLALLYQHSAGPEIRATLGACFALGSSISLLALGLAGQVNTGHLVTVAWLLPFLVAGFLLSGPARRFLHGRRMRVAVLSVATVSALVLLTRSVVG